MNCDNGHTWYFYEKTIATEDYIIADIEIPEDEEETIYVTALKSKGYDVQDVLERGIYCVYCNLTLPNPVSTEYDL